MNILVKTCSGKTIVRPDTTWERDNEDLYVPEFVRSLSFTPVIFARICKPGRSVGLNFAERYFDDIGYGVLLYPDDMLDGSPEAFACASCLDHSSFLNLSTVNVRPMDDADSVFELFKEADTIFRTGAHDKSLIAEAIHEATKAVYVRSGDIIAIELDKMQKLCSLPDKTVRVSGKWNNETVVDFCIHF